MIKQEDVVMEISTDMKKVKDSKCFGIAWDGEVKECKICEVANMCKQRTLGSVKQVPPTASKPATKKADKVSTVDTMAPSNPRPEPKNQSDDVKKPAKKSAAKSSKKSSKSDKPAVNYAPDMPDFKPMSVDELLALAKDRGLNPAEFDSYTHANIKKMRVTMALKKTYEV